MKTILCVARAARASANRPASSFFVSISRASFAFLLFVLFPFLSKAQAVTGIITDYKGYWKSAAASPNPIKPDNSHNLLAFTYNGVQYSTGVNDALLLSKGETFTQGDFWSLPAGGMTGTITSNTKIGLGAMFDNVFNGCGSFLPDYHLSTYLTDGIKGLNIGTCIANLPVGSMNFNIANIQASSIGDGVPDILVTQVADPTGNSYDRYEFTDANGNRVGNYKDIVFTSITPVANWTADFFESTPVSSLPALLTGFTQTDRPMRLWAADLSDFGITASNISRIRNFKINLCGNSDVAFVAYNNKSVNFQTPLPVKYSFFKGALNDNKVNLSWQTTAEWNTNEFVVERSADGSSFTSIGSIKARNSISSTNDYSFTDAAPLAGAGYYRIRQTDMDGKSNVTGIVKIQRTVAVAVHAYPIPARDWLYVDYPSATGNESISLYNALGLVMARQHPASGSVQTKIGLQGLSTGSYYLVFESGSERTSTKIIVN